MNDMADIDEEKSCLHCVHCVVCRITPLFRPEWFSFYFEDAETKSRETRPFLDELAAVYAKRCAHYRFGEANVESLMEQMGHDG